MIDPATLASPELIALCRRCHVRSLDLFGSATTDRFDPARSDFDFLVAFEDVPAGQSFDVYFSLSEGLQALFGRKIDLVEERAVKNPFLRQQLMATKQRVFPQP